MQLGGLYIFVMNDPLALKAIDETEKVLKVKTRAK